MLTIESAYALLIEPEIGSLNTGKLTDLIILSANPIKVHHDSILGLDVLITLVGRVVEYCAAEGVALCP